MTRLVIAMFTETPTATIVVTPRLRRIASRSVPPIGPTPCQLASTTSSGAGPNSGSSVAPSLPGLMSTAVAAHGEDRGVVVRAEPVGPPLHQAVHDLHARRAGGGEQPFDVGQRLAARLLGEDGQAGVRPDDGALELLGDDRGVSGRGDLGEVDFHTDRRVRDLVKLRRPLTHGHIGFRVHLDSAGCSTYSW